MQHCLHSFDLQELLENAKEVDYYFKNSNKRKVWNRSNESRRLYRTTLHAVGYFKHPICILLTNIWRKLQVVWSLPALWKLLGPFLHNTSLLRSFIAIVLFNFFQKIVCWKFTFLDLNLFVWLSSCTLLVVPQFGEHNASFVSSFVFSRFIRGLWFAVLNV